MIDFTVLMLVSIASTQTFHFVSSAASSPLEIEVSEAIRNIKKIKPSFEQNDLMRGIFDLDNSNATDKDVLNASKIFDFYDIKIFSACNTRVAGSCFDKIKNFNKISYIDMYHSSFDDDGLSNLRKNESLSVLRIGRCRVTTKGLQFIGTHKRLHTLDISENQIHDTDLIFLKDLGAIRSLNLSYNSLTDGCFCNFPKTQRIETLFLTDNKITNLGFECLARSFPEISLLNIKDNNIDNISDLNKLTKLEILNMSNTNVQLIDKSCFAECKMIKHVFAESTPAGSSLLKCLIDSRSLESITIGPNNLEYLDINNFIKKNNASLKIRFANFKPQFFELIRNDRVIFELIQDQ